MLTQGRVCIASRSAVGYAGYRPKVCLWLTPFLFQAQTSSENALTCCMKCGAVVKDTDAILDAIRIGQEALDKATRLQVLGLSVPSLRLPNLIELLVDRTFESNTIDN